MDAWDPNNRMIKNLMGLSGGVWLGGGWEISRG